MATKRRKMEPTRAPQTLDEAIGLVTRYVTIETEIERLDGVAKSAVAEVRGTRDAAAKPLEQELKGILASLRNWWAVASSALAGDRRSAELAGCTIGVRLTPPKVVSKRPEDEVTQLLVEAGLTAFVRVDYVLNKPAIVAALRDPQTDAERAVAARLIGLGLTVAQRDEFFVARPEERPAVEVVQEQAA